MLLSLSEIVHNSSREGRSFPTYTFPWHVEEVDVNSILRHGETRQGVRDSSLDLRIVLEIDATQRVHAAQGGRRVASPETHTGIIANANCDE